MRLKTELQVLSHSVLCLRDSPVCAPPVTYLASDYLPRLSAHYLQGCLLKVFHLRFCLSDRPDQIAPVLRPTTVKSISPPGSLTNCSPPGTGQSAGSGGGGRAGDRGLLRSTGSQAPALLPLLLPGLQDLFSPQQQLRKTKICPKQTHQVLPQTQLPLDQGSRDPGRRDLEKAAAEPPV